MKNAGLMITTSLLGSLIAAAVGEARLQEGSATPRPESAAMLVKPLWTVDTGG